MSERAFSEARRRVVGAYRQADYVAALRIAEEAAIEFPDRADKTAYWVACLHALLGDRERALRILEDGFAQGLWWAPELLDADPDLADLRSDDRFRAIVSGSERIRASVAAGLPTDPLLRPPVEPPADVVLVLLHGRGESAEDIGDQWAAARRAFIVVPRSTQPLGMSAMCWDDPQRAEADVLHAVEVASSQVNLAGLPLLTAGFSQGAAMAIVLAARRRLPGIVGFIGVTPSVGWAPDLLDPGELHAEGIRGHLITGSLDPRRDDCQRLAQHLRENGAEVRLDVVEGLDHEYPPDFDDRLPEAMTWVLQGGN